MEVLLLDTLKPIVSIQAVKALFHHSNARLPLVLRWLKAAGPTLGNNVFPPLRPCIKVHQADRLVAFLRMVDSSTSSIEHLVRHLRSSPCEECPLERRLVIHQLAKCHSSKDEATLTLSPTTLLLSGLGSWNNKALLSLPNLHRSGTTITVRRHPRTRGSLPSRTSPSQKQIWNRLVSMQKPAQLAPDLHSDMPRSWSRHLTYSHPRVDVWMRR